MSSLNGDIFESPLEDLNTIVEYLLKHKNIQPLWRKRMNSS